MKPEIRPRIHADSKEFESRVLLVCAAFSGLDYSDVIALVALVTRAVLDKNPLPKEARRVFRHFWKVSKGHESEVPFSVVPKGLVIPKDHTDCAKCEAVDYCPNPEASMFKTPRTVH
jgi:hypothetical protein